MLKIRRPLGHLIFNMGITIPGKTVFLIEMPPRLSTEFDEVTCCIHSNYSIQLIVWRHNCAGFRLFHDWVLCLFQICDLFLLICVNKGAIVWHICGESPFHWWFPFINNVQCGAREVYSCVVRQIDLWFGLLDIEQIARWFKIHKSKNRGELTMAGNN